MKTYDAYVYQTVRHYIGTITAKDQPSAKREAQRQLKAAPSVEWLSMGYEVEDQTINIKEASGD